MLKNRYFKITPGRLFDFIGITNDNDYTAQATLALFQANSTKAGDIGVFNAATGALISGAGAVSTTLPIFIAINTGIDIIISPTFKVADLKMVRTPYVAPVAYSRVTILTSVTPTVGQVYTVKIIDASVGGHPLNTFDYSYTIKAGDTFNTALTNLAAMITDKTAVAVKDRDVLASASYNTGTTTLTITGLTTGVQLITLFLDDLAAVANTSDTITKAVTGSGFYAEAKMWEDYATTGRGQTTKYPLAGTKSSEYGEPVSVVDANGTACQYNHYTFTWTKSDSSKLNRKVDYWNGCIELLVNASATNKSEEEIKAIFGL